MNGIIILGAPRSGTTLLRRLLDAHPALCCPGETFLMRGAARFMEHDTISGGFEYGALAALEGLGIKREETLSRLRDFTFGFYNDLAAKAGKKKWVAKTAVDSFYLPQIEALYAGHCKFIVLQRHGLDVASSMEEFSRDLQAYIGELHAYIRQNPHPLEAFAQAWADVTNGLIDFAARNAADAHVLKYEDLVHDPAGEMRKITDFLGEKPLAAISLGSEVGGIGDWKSFGKSTVETSGAGRWKNLPAAVIERLAPLVNPTLARAGYETVAANGDDAARRKELAQMLMQGKNQ